MEREREWRLVRGFLWSFGDFGLHVFPSFVLFTSLLLPLCCSILSHAFTGYD